MTTRQKQYVRGGLIALVLLVLLPDLAFWRYLVAIVLIAIADNET